MSKKKTLTIIIKGLPWIVRLYTNKTFVSKHGRTIRAVTMFDPDELHFNRAHFIRPVVLHELTHAYHDSCLTSDATLEGVQTEEVIAKIIENHYDDFGTHAQDILDYFGGESGK